MFWAAVDPFQASRSFGVNLDLGLALAPALVEAWYVGNIIPWESQTLHLRLLAVVLRRKCSIAAVLVDIGS
jgi:hypothetical protein